MLAKLLHFIVPEGKDFFADETRVSEFKTLVGSKISSDEFKAAGLVYSGIHVGPAKITRIDVFTNGLPVLSDAQTAATIAFRNALEADGFDIISDEAQVADIAEVAKLGDFDTLTIKNGVLITEIKPAA